MQRQGILKDTVICQRFVICLEEYCLFYIVRSLY